MQIRVVVHGVTRERSTEDAEGAGFYTARDVEAQNIQHASELALLLVRRDSRSRENAPDGIVRLFVKQAFEIAPSEANDKHGYIYYDGQED
jgi:hypothetical protein